MIVNLHHNSCPIIIAIRLSTHEFEESGPNEASQYHSSRNNYCYHCLDQIISTMSYYVGHSYTKTSVFFAPNYTVTFQLKTTMIVIEGKVCYYSLYLEMSP